MTSAHNLTGERLAVAAGDLAIISVLLDAGAGSDWSYSDEPTGLRLGRSEGLALASIRLFGSGTLSSFSDDPLRRRSGTDALTAKKLGEAFQVTDKNSLIGLNQRAGLLQKLGRVINDQKSFFARDGSARPGNIIPALAERNRIKARDILVTLLQTLAEIWPSPVKIHGQPLGDVGYHDALVRTDPTNRIIPFHKLSQWMSYSLIEPIQEFGGKISDLDGLTGLAEYRNGGLFVDTGVLTLKDKNKYAEAHPLPSELIVEWRALTVALLDRLAEGIRHSLDMSATIYP